MQRTGLYAVIAVLAILAGVAGVYAYQEHQKDENSLQIEVGPKGVKVDPPG